MCLDKHARGPLWPWMHISTSDSVGSLAYAQMIAGRYMSVCHDTYEQMYPGHPLFNKYLRADDYFRIRSLHYFTCMSYIPLASSTLLYIMRT